MGRQRSRARRLDELKEAIDGAHGFWRLDTLRWAVGAALKEPAPKGRPADIANHGLMVTRAGRECASEHAYTRAYARETLPETWFGMTAVSATQAMSALDGELRRAADTLDQAGATLTALAASITAAQARDALGRGPLWHAKQILDHMATPVFDHVARPVFDVARPVFDHVARPVFDHDGDQLMLAHREAREGIAHLAAAAHIADDAGRLAARRLDELSTVARGARLNTRSLTDLDKLVLADAAVPPGAPASGSSAGPAAAPAVPSGLGLHDHNLILTAAAAGRAADRMEQMSPEDRRRFDALLSEARSAQERARGVLYEVKTTHHGTESLADLREARIGCTRRRSPLRVLDCRAGATGFTRLLILMMNFSYS